MEAFIKSNSTIFIIVLIIIGVLIVGKLLFDTIVASDYMISRAIKRRNVRNQQVAEGLLSPDHC